METQLRALASAPLSDSILCAPERQMEEVHSSDVHWNQALGLPMANAAPVSDEGSKRARTDD